MSFTVYWSPNQASVAQIETATLVGAPSTGNTFSATLNGKTVTYTALSTDTTAALFATGLFNLLNVTTGIAAEFTEITFTNPSAQIVATAATPGVPFANVPGTSAGLVFSTGNGYTGTLTQVHTQANQSPSDVNDPQNWLRVNLGNTPPSKTRALPVNGDDVVVSNSSVPMLYNLDQLAAIQFNTYTRWQSFTGTIGLPPINPNGYTEWRATDFKFSGPTGSAPAGGLAMVLGYSSGSGSGPTRERYDLGSSRFTCQVLAAGSPQDEYGVHLIGYHTDNVVIAESGTSVGIATAQGELSKVNSVTGSSATVALGAGVTWTTNIFGTASSCTMYGGSLLINSPPATLSLNNGTQATFATDSLVWPSITAQGGCTLTWLAGGTITTYTATTGCTLNKSGDNRALTITNHTIDGDTCQFIDPLNAITWTNAGTVKQQVSSGPYQFTGTRTVKVT